ncbi:ADP-ribosylation factor-related protein 1 [Hordeum vulgare]|nr:ADP-ribosylation factor-related protein 1 [Hordeum vulgare]
MGKPWTGHCPQFPSPPRDLLETRQPRTLALSSNSPAAHLAAAMGLRNYGRKGNHAREVGSSSGRRGGSVKEEAASPPRRASVVAPFTIAPRPVEHRDRQYLSIKVCQRYWETRTSVPWSDVHLPNAWHLSVDRVPIPPVPTSGRARREGIERRRRLLPHDIYYDERYTADSTLWDTWVRDEHDMRRASYLAGTNSGPRRAREEQEARLMQRVMEDSITTHDERQWPGLDRAMALSAAGDVAIPEQMEEEEVVAFPPELVGASWGWSCTMPEMAQAVGAVNWRSTPL